MLAAPCLLPLGVRNLRLRRKTPAPSQVEVRQTVVLSHLPCWKHLTPEEYRARVLVGHIEAAAAAERAKQAWSLSVRKDPGAGPGDPARDSGSLTGSLCPCRDAEDPQ